MDKKIDECPMCGLKISQGVKFCNGCGLKLNEIQLKRDEKGEEEGNHGKMVNEITIDKPVDELSEDELKTKLRAILLGTIGLMGVCLIVWGFISANIYGSQVINIQIGLSLIIIGIIIAAIFLPIYTRRNHTSCSFISCGLDCCCDDCC